MMDGGSSGVSGLHAAQAGARAGPGSPTDALTALAETVSSETKQARLGEPDHHVSDAFALGWQVAELYRPDRGNAAPQPVSDDDLPGLSRLSEAEWTEIGLDQVQAGTAKLWKPIFEAGLEPPDAQEFASIVNAVTDEAARTQAIRDFHIDLLAVLTAADYRLGKAYGVGRALADTTRPPVDYQAELTPPRVATISGWIRALATALPPHAAHPVADSLDAWSRWAHPRELQERVNVDVTVAKLAPQGRLWRSLLSAEKRPTDTLETSDYLHAAEGMLRQSAALAMRFLKHYWWLVLLIVVLFVAGIVVVAISSRPAGVVAGAASILASLGLGWKGAGSAVGRAGSRVEQPLWGAQVDTVIYERITPQTIVDSQRALKKGPDESSLATS
jgi:hypothetical protein